MEKQTAIYRFSKQSGDHLNVIGEDSIVDIDSTENQNREIKGVKRHSSESRNKGGRKVKPFSRAKNKRDKLKKLNEKITEIAGGKEIYYSFDVEFSHFQT